MQAVILAAGRGTRLGMDGSASSKGLLEVGGQSLIEHQIHALEQAGIHEICIVTGHGAAAIKDRIGSRVTYVHNGRFADTSSLFSLCCALEWMRGPTIVANCDVLAHPSVFQQLRAMCGTAIAYDGRNGYDEEQMKVVVENGSLREISKGIEPERSSGEHLGIIRFCEKGLSLLPRAALRALTSDSEVIWVPTALNYLVRHLPVRCLEIEGLPWIEVDYRADLTRAQSVVWPRIQAALLTTKAGHSMVTRFREAS